MIIGGVFLEANGMPVNNIATWNGSSWGTLGAGLNDNVAALGVYGGDLYAGGDFTHAGDLEVNHIARWDGGAWHAVGGGMSGGWWPAVTSLLVSGGDLYVGGWFLEAGGSAANFIARWNGSSWFALGEGTNDNVLTLCTYNGDLIAGGQFTEAGGAPANRIARWGGTSWSPLGDGLGGWVHDVALFGDGLFVGGEFTTAGGCPSYYIARWEDGVGAAVDRPVASSLGLRAPSLIAPGAQVAFSIEHRTDVRLSVHDLEGREIVRLYEGHLAAGEHGVPWTDRPLARGAYFLRLRTGTETASRRVIAVH